MANEEKKDFNAMLHCANGMPKVQLVTDEATVKKYGGTRMYFAPPLAYDTPMRQRLAVVSNYKQSITTFFAKK